MEGGVAVEELPTSAALAFGELCFAVHGRFLDGLIGLHVGSSVVVVEASSLHGATVTWPSCPNEATLPEIDILSVAVAHTAVRLGRART